MKASGHELSFGLLKKTENKKVGTIWSKEKLELKLKPIFMITTIWIRDIHKVIVLLKLLWAKTKPLPVKTLKTSLLPQLKTSSFLINLFWNLNYYMQTLCTSKLLHFIRSLVGNIKSNTILSRFKTQPKKIKAISFTWTITKKVPMWINVQNLESTL